MPLSIAHADHGEGNQDCGQHCDCDDVHCVSFVCVVVLYACIITRSCCFVNPYRGQFRNFLGLVQPAIDRFVDDNQNGDDEKSMHCVCFLVVVALYAPIIYILST